ncbi:MAG: FixH family protein [Cyclobacteriaceae bacterium]|nr:FixH family protein [Cyclobacteriaceae bacterium]
MNFGKWIVVAFIAFAGFIATLVAVCVRQDINLVSDDYYREELLHQEKISFIQNANQLRERPEISIDGSMVTVSFSDFNKIEKGELMILRPSDNKLDRRFRVESSSNPVQQFPLSEWSKGLYRASMQWTMEGKVFYVEKIIVL